MAKRKRNENEESNERRRRKRARNDAPHQAAPGSIPGSIPGTLNTTVIQTDLIHGHPENATALAKGKLEKSKKGSLPDSNQRATTHKVVKKSRRQKETDNSALKPFGPKDSNQEDIGHQDHQDFKGTSDKMSKFETKVSESRKGIEPEALKSEAKFVKKEGKKDRKRHRARLKAGNEKPQLENTNEKHKLKALQPARDQQGLQDDQNEQLPVTKDGEQKAKTLNGDVARRDDVRPEKVYIKSKKHTVKKWKRHKERQALKDQDQGCGQKVQSKDMGEARNQSKSRAENNVSSADAQGISSNWSISIAGGGLMLDIDPVFSPDEKSVSICEHS